MSRERGMRGSDQEPGATALMPRAQGEAERGERPVNVPPAERASHGRRAPGFQAEQGAKAKKAQERCDLADVGPMKAGFEAEGLLRPAGVDDVQGRTSVAGGRTPGATP